MIAAYRLLSYQSPSRLVWSAAAWRCSTIIRWTRWTPSD